MIDLDTLTDTLNEVLQRVEAVFALTGVSTRIPVGPAHYLGFKKIGKKWRLTWAKGDEEPIALLDASRKDRLEAAKNIENLHASILSHQESIAKDMHETIVRLEKFVESLEAKAQEDGH